MKSTKLEVNNGVANLTLCRKGKGNSLNFQMVREISDAIKSISSDSTVKVIVIDSLNSEFCVGGDIDYIFNSDKSAQSLLSEMVQLWHKTIICLTTCPQIVMVSINGSVAGGGLGIVLAADYVIASKNSSFSTGFLKLALSCDSGLSWFLPRQIGARRAKQFLLIDEPITADTALEWGLLDSLVEQEENRQRVKELVTKFLKISPLAVKKIKNLLNSSFNNELARQLDLEQESIVDTAGSEEAKNCVADFLARRKDTDNS